LLVKIADLVKEKRIIAISGLRDESDRKGMRIVIELKQNADANVVLNQLYKHTQLQQSFGVIMLALVDGVPQVLSLREVLQHYITHQQIVIRRRTEYDLRKAKERAHLLEGYVIALDNIDEIIKVIRSSYDDAKQRLMDSFTLSEIQATAILEMQLRRLQGLEREKIENELAELREKIAYYEKILGDENLILQIIKEEMAEIRDKFAAPRRTTIGGDARILDVEDLIAEEDMVVNITKAGYVKRLPVATYRQQKRGGKGVAGTKLKDNDFVENMFVASTHDYVLFFSTKGKVYRLKVHEIPVGSRHARGTAVVNLLPFEKDERIAAVINTKDFPEEENLLFATASGMIKKTNLKAYSRVHAGGIIAISLIEGDELISVRRVQEGQRVIMVSSAGKAVLFEESQARPMGRDTRGVKGMTVKDDARVLGMEIAPDEAQLFVVTERGFGKRTCISVYPVHKRGGQGVKTIVMTPKKGLLVGMKIIDEDHELMLMSEEGIMIRVKAKDISLLGRSTQGVKVMNVADSDRVSAIARVSSEKKKVATDKEAEQASLLDADTEEDE
ncbi:MAG: DNA gyrase subunit A, partial [Coriobacteriia bacterium]|nr:DNA gyrase subunit A [Coriobacteriia bacterium]